MTGWMALLITTEATHGSSPQIVQCQMRKIRNRNAMLSADASLPHLCRPKETRHFPLLEAPWKVWLRNCPRATTVFPSQARPQKR